VPGDADEVVLGDRGEFGVDPAHVFADERVALAERVVPVPAELALATGGPRRDGDPVAGLEPRDPLAHLGHDARRVAPGDVWELARRGPPPPGPDVEVVQPSGLHLDQTLVARYPGVGLVAVLQHVPVAVLLVVDCLHRPEFRRVAPKR
jgi:hypothetical protein